MGRLLRIFCGNRASVFVNEHVCLPLHRKSTDGPRQEDGKGEADSLREMKKPEEKGNGLPSAESIGTPSEDAPQGNDSWQRIVGIGQYKEGLTI